MRLKIGQVSTERVRDYLQNITNCINIDNREEVFVNLNNVWYKFCNFM